VLDELDVLPLSLLSLLCPPLSDDGGGGGDDGVYDGASPKSDVAGVGEKPSSDDGRGSSR